MTVGELIEKLNEFDKDLIVETIAHIKISKIELTDVCPIKGNCNIENRPNERFCNCDPHVQIM